MRKSLIVPIAILTLAGAACGSGKTESRQTASSPPPAAKAAPAQAGAVAPRGGGVSPLSSSGNSAAAPATSGLTIYGDDLAAKWQSWSWDSTIDLGVTKPVYSGARAISFTLSTAWGGFYLHSDVPIDTAPFTYLRFAAQASQPGQRYAAVLVDENDRFIGAPVFLANYGDITAGVWKYYHVPLADLGGAGKRIKGIVIQDGLGKLQPALYLDDIGLQ
ncbi:MAG: hypothetical protein ACR2PL_21675 [Dehalococcoidia bacterium]